MQPPLTDCPVNFVSGNELLSTWASRAAHDTCLPRAVHESLGVTEKVQGDRSEDGHGGKAAVLSERSASQSGRHTKDSDNTRDTTALEGRPDSSVYRKYLCSYLHFGSSLQAGSGSSSRVTPLVELERPVALEIIWVFSETRGCAEEKGPVDFSRSSDCVVL